MKRIALLTVLLLVVGLSLGFGQEVKTSAVLTGYGQVTWAVDLDTMQTGFKNESDADLVLTLLVKDGSVTHNATDAAVYGEIKIKNVEAYWDDGTFNLGMPDTDVEAKIVAGAFAFGVYSAPGMDFEKLDPIENDDVDDDIVDPETAAAGKTNETDPTFSGTAFANDQGTWFSATFAPVTLTVRLVSDGDWAANVDGNYAAGLDAVLDVAPVKVTLGLSEDWVNSITGFYARLDLTAAPIVVWVGAEGSNNGEAAADAQLTYAAGGGLTFTLMADTTLAASFLYGAAFHGADIKVVFTEPGDAGLIPMLDLSETLYVLDVSDPATAPLDMEYESITTVGYKVALNDTQSVRPYATVTYGLNGEDSQNRLEAEVGAEMKLFPLTTLTLKYVSGNLSADPSVTGTVQAVAKVAF